MTTWRPISGWTGLYEVSDDGQVRSLPRKHTKGRVLKPGSNSRGYRIAVLSANGERVAFPVHRLVAEAFIGPMPHGWHTCHRDGDKTNNTVGNLYYGTPSRNELDKVAQGLNPNANKTHCPRGHEYTADNTIIQTGGRRPSRKCRACHRMHKAAYDARTRRAAAQQDVAS